MGPRLDRLRRASIAAREAGLPPPWSAYAPPFGCARRDGYRFPFALRSHDRSCRAEPCWGSYRTGRKLLLTRTFEVNLLFSNRFASAVRQGLVYFVGRLSRPIRNDLDQNTSLDRVGINTGQRDDRGRACGNGTGAETRAKSGKDRPKRLSSIALTIAVAAPLAGLGLLAAVAWSPAPAQAHSIDTVRHAGQAAVSTENGGRRRS